MMNNKKRDMDIMDKIVELVPYLTNTFKSNCASGIHIIEFTFNSREVSLHFNGAEFNIYVNHRHVFNTTDKVEMLDKLIELKNEYEKEGGE